MVVESVGEQLVQKSVAVSLRLVDLQDGRGLFKIFLDLLLWVWSGRFA